MAQPGTVMSVFLSVYIWALLFIGATEAVDMFAGNLTTNNDKPLLMTKRHNNKQRERGGRNTNHQGGGKPTTTSVLLNEFMVGTIGLGEIDFEVIFDSGSRGTWVFGKEVEDYFFGDPALLAKQFEYDHTFYDEDKSKTFKPYDKEPKPADMCVAKRYADVCGVSGKSGYETLKIGDELEVHETCFQVASKINGPENQFSLYDGMFGLEYESPSSDNLSVFSQMVHKGLLSLNLFSVYMTNDGMSGEIMFGGWDKARVHGPIEVVDVAPPSTNDGSTPWEVHVNRLKFGDNSFTRIYPALVDTGTAAITIPKSVLVANNWMETHKHIADALDKRSKTRGFVPCDARDELPPLAFGIGTRTYSLSGRDYTASPDGGLAYTDRKTGYEWCALLLRPGVEESIRLGAPFFRRYYTIFFHDHSYEGSDSSPKVGFGEIDHLDDQEEEESDTKKQQKMDEDYFPYFWCGGTLFGEFCS